MTDRYHGGYAPAGRSQTFNNPARSSMPSSIGYSSLYAGDMHVMPSSARGHPMTTPRGYTTSTTANGVPTTTRTYAVTQEPRTTVRPSTAARETSRTRRSTMDSSPRPPVIVTTTQKAGQHAPSSSHASGARVTSPVRNGHRASETQFYTQPASSIHSRNAAPQYPRGHADVDDYARPRDRTDSNLAVREAEAYRSSRPSVVYPSDPRHSTAAIDYGDEGYQYTTAGELAKYDLENTRPNRSRRRESVDRGYYRPNISYNTDQRSFNVNTSADLSRNYNMNTSRPYEGGPRGGPPPSTRGFDRIGSAFESARDVPPAAPVPPSPSIVRQSDAVGPSADPRDGRRSRPVSLYQESAPRSSHHDDYYRSREDERNMRELRERERESERTHEAPYFQDGGVSTRGFGLRIGGPSDTYDDRRDRRRESWQEEPRRRSDEEVLRDQDLDRERRRRSRIDDRDEPRTRSDEELLRDSDLDRERRRKSRQDDKDEPRRRSDEDVSRIPDSDRERRRPSKLDGIEEYRERRESKRGTDEERSRFRDKLASGVGIAAAAVGLGPPPKEDDAREKSDKEPRRRRSPTDEHDRRPELEGHDRSGVDGKDRQDDRSREKDREYERDREHYEPKDEAERRERHRRDAEAKISGEATTSVSDSEEGKKSSFRNRLSSAFNPNDAGDIHKLREQLAAMDPSDTKEPKGKEPAIVETRASRSISPPKHSPVDPSKEESRGRELAISNPEEKMVRVVSPPRDKKDEKPLKGILKQPSARFPEEDSYIREGVAPHKEDKKAKDVPAGARWTKISRKVVNPEALTVGKERFEIRDDFVIVLRVLSKEEIQAYAAATQVLRERRRGRDDDDYERDDSRDRDDDDGHRQHHRRYRDEGYDTEDMDRDRERDRRRRHRREEDEDEYDRRARGVDHHHHRSHREV